MQPHPRLPGDLKNNLADAVLQWPVEHVEEVFGNVYLRVTVDSIVDGQGGVHDRVVVHPKGAVGVLAIDEQDRVLVVEQYRHPVGLRMIEIPAGTLDVEGERPLAAAKRELGEEADVAADEWHELIQLAATPGYSTEIWTVFRATGLSPLPEAQRTQRVAEEAEMSSSWIQFDQLVGLIVAGKVRDSLTVGAVLIEAARRNA